MTTPPGMHVERGESGGSAGADGAVALRAGPGEGAESFPAVTPPRRAEGPIRGARRAALGVRAVETATAAVPALVALALVAYVVHRAVVLRIDYFDAYVYLANAARIAGQEGPPIHLIRPPLVPYLLAPLVALSRALPVGHPAALVLPHVGMASGVALLVFAVYRLARRALAPRHACLAVTFLVGNELFVRYAAFALTDVLSALLAALGVLGWTWARGARSFFRFGVAGIALSAAPLAKYTFLSLVPTLLVAELVVALRARRLDDRRLLGLVFAGGVSAAVFVLVERAYFEAAGAPFGLAPLVATLEQARSAVVAWAGEARDDYRELARATMPSVLGPLAAVGAVASLRRRAHPLEVIVAVWAALTLFAVTRVPHTEARYLYAAVPPCALLAGMGVARIEALASWLAARDRPTPSPARRWFAPAVGLACTLGAILSIAAPVGRRLGADRDPVFTRGVALELARRVDALRGDGGRVLWQGGLHTFVTAAPTPHPTDEFFDTFHFSAEALAHLVRAPVVVLGARGPDARRDFERLARPGDVLVRVQPVSYTTGDLLLRPPAAGAIDTSIEVLDARRFVTLR